MADTSRQEEGSELDAKSPLRGFIIARDFAASIAEARGEWDVGSVLGVVRGVLGRRLPSAFPDLSRAQTP
jgi:hypothetical protein